MGKKESASCHQSIGKELHIPGATMDDTTLRDGHGYESVECSRVRGISILTWQVCRKMMSNDCQCRGVTSWMMEHTRRGCQCGYYSTLLLRPVEVYVYDALSHETPLHITNRSMRQHCRLLRRSIMHRDYLKVDLRFISASG